MECVYHTHIYIYMYGMYTCIVCLAEASLKPFFGLLYDDDLLCHDFLT